MHDSPGGASNCRSLLTTKVRGISLIVTVIGLLTLLLDFFPCQSIELLSQWNLEYLIMVLFYLFFIVLFLWPIWWSIDSDNLNSSQKISSVIKISLVWSIALLYPWLIGLGITGVFLPKTSTWLRSGVALLGLNHNFWKQIKPRERKAALIPWGISLMICLAIFYSEHPDIKPKNFAAKSSEFAAVVALVDSGKLTPDNNGFSSLPCRYSYLANSGSKFGQGRIKITKEEEATIIQFQQKIYGFGDGVDDFIYRSDNKDISRPPNSLGDGVIKLKDHWFWQTLRD